MKLRNPLTNDGAVGLTQFDVLSLGGPYQTKVGPGFVVNTRNGFPDLLTTETEAVLDEPYLWYGYFPTAGYAVTRFNVSFAQPERSYSKDFAPSTYPTDSKVAFPVALFVGDGYIATMHTSYDAGAQPITFTNWPVLSRGINLNTAAPGSAGFAWSFEGQAQPSYPRSMFATGWGSSAYRWGYAVKPMLLWTSDELAPGSFYLNPGDTVIVVSRPLATTQPYVMLGDTSGGALTRVDLPAEDDMHGHVGGFVHVCGPGKLIALVCVYPHVDVVESPPGTFTYTATHVDPYIARSDDHGETWSRTTASFLSGWFEPYPDDGSIDDYNAAVANVPIVALVASSTFFVYVGQGKTLMFVRQLTSTSVTRLFIYDGATFTPTAWPGDAGQIVAPLNVFAEVPVTGGLSLGDRVMRPPTSYCFGEGCAAVYAQDASNPFLINRLVTRDFGATWEVQNAAPFTSFSIVTQSPYTGESKKGRILLTRRNDAADGVDCFSTDGEFTVFKRLGPIPLKGAPGTTGSNSLYTPTIVAKRKGPSLELPSEFNKP